MKCYEQESQHDYEGVTLLDQDLWEAHVQGSTQKDYQKAGVSMPTYTQ